MAPQYTRRAGNWQGIGEFFSAVTRRTRIRCRAEDAGEEINRIVRLPGVGINPARVQRGICTHKRYGAAFWDVLSIAAAERAGCVQMILEDLSPGQSHTGIVVKNLF